LERLILSEFLSQKYWGNTIQDYLLSVGTLILALILIFMIKTIVLRRLRNRCENQQQRTSLEFVIRNVNRFIIPAIFLGAVYLALEFLSFSVKAEKIIKILYALAATWLAIKFIITAVDIFLNNYFQKFKGDEDSKKVKPLISFINFFVWVTGLLFLLDNLGFQISTVIAGLGITGIAVALAAQALLGDLFSYFVIFFDRPFEIGDFIVFDGFSGNIEKIGIKTTKLRSISGEQLIVANSKLTNTLLRNYKRMEKRRIVFNLNVSYKTTSKQLKLIPQMVKDIITEFELAEYDRGNFQQFGESSLSFEFVYYVLSPEYNVYMDMQEKINLAIHERFNKSGIEFAYPARSIFINESGKSK
jgi:small-conductance mechanosensitive channel